MRKYYFLLLSSLFLFLSSCDKKNNQLEVVSDLDLNFKASFGNEPLIMNQSYDYNGDLTLFFSKFNFYISELSLLTKDCASGQIELSEIELIDFTDVNTSPQSAAAGFTLNFKNVPIGEYTGIRLGLGVSPELNREEPAMFSASHPLGNASQYWEGWSSYIFAKVEGRGDTDQDGSFDLGFAYHTGSDVNFRPVCLLKDLTVTDGQVGGLDINLDLRKLFVQNGEFFDIKNTPGTHTEEGINTSTTLMDNFEDAFTIE